LDPTVTTTPEQCCAIRRVTAREMLKRPVVLTAKVAAQSSSVRDATEFMRRIPATFTRMRALVQANPAGS
jgi:hypothetical protein